MIFIPTSSGRANLIRPSRTSVTPLSFILVTGRRLTAIQPSSGHRKARAALIPPYNLVCNNHIKWSVPRQMPGLCQVKTVLIDVITHFSNSETRNLDGILKLKFPYKSQQDSRGVEAGAGRVCTGCMMYGVSWLVHTRFVMSANFLSGLELLARGGGAGCGSGQWAL